jgi:hypothetical protein
MQTHSKPLHTLLRLILLPIILSISCHNVYAGTTAYIKELQSRASSLQLWQQREWINLLHYNKDSDSTNQFISQVDDVRFFNAPDGKNNPKTELLQTISSFFSTEVNGDAHPQCRFIARLDWLQDKLGIDSAVLPNIICKDYMQWRALVPDQKITLIFPAYHLNSPSSMFGHTLLRLDSAEGKMGSDWLSMAINFGANVREDDNSLFYAFRGLTGGYPGFFIVTPYYNKIKEYNSKEKRDIWEYPLNLTTEETSRMVTHLWELKGVEFDYYFFDENCSYRLLELLEVARPSVELTDGFTLTAIPVDTVRAIKRAGMITGVSYRPSQITVLEYLLEQIPDKNIDLIEPISKDYTLINKDIFKSLDEHEQIQVLQAAYKYLRYLQTDSVRDPQSARNSHKLLVALNNYPIQQPIKPPVPTSQPEQGHYSNRLSIGFGQENKQSYTELSFRFSFHSLEDNEHGFLQGAQINFGSFIARATEDENLKLQQFDLIEIFSLTARTQFFKPLSWKIYTGMERQLTFGQQRLATHVTGGVGFAYKPFDNDLVYGLLMARLEKNRGFKRNIVPAYGLSAGILHHFGSSTARVELSGEEFHNNVFRYRGMYVHNFNLATNHSLKFTAMREKQAFIEFTEARLTYQYYFF